MGARLSDIHINMAQKLLKEPLMAQLLQGKEIACTEEMVRNT